jgi:hypothetical protein
MVVNSQCGLCHLAILPASARIRAFVEGGRVDQPTITQAFLDIIANGPAVGDSNDPRRINPKYIGG